MNLILLNPSADSVAQVIIQGKKQKNIGPRGIDRFKAHAWSVVTSSLLTLQSQYHFIVIESAKIPADANLWQWDIVNMNISHLADVPVILVGDIDAEGVFGYLSLRICLTASMRMVTLVSLTLALLGGIH